MMCYCWFIDLEVKVNILNLLHNYETVLMRIHCLFHLNLFLSN